MLYARDEEHLLRILCPFLVICRTRCLIVSLPKSEFFLNEVSWCGSLIDKGFNP